MSRRRSTVYFPAAQTFHDAPRRYGFWAFVLDCFLTLITSGLWIIWIFVREMRRSR